MSLSADQTLPSVLSRHTSPPFVYEVAIDTDFEAARSNHGTVNFALTASSRPNVHSGDIERVSHSRFQPRGFLDEQDQLSKRAYLAQGIQGKAFDASRPISHYS